MTGKPDSEYVPYSQVVSFMQMSQQVITYLKRQIEQLQTTADESEDAAAEETTFLADTVQKLLSERQQLLEELHDIKREHSLLSKENVLLKNELLSHEAGLSPNQKGSPLKRRDNNTIEVTLFPRC